MPAFSRFLALRIINYFKPLSSLSLNISLLRFPTYMCVCVSVCFCAEHISTFWQNGGQLWRTWLLLGRSPRPPLATSARHLTSNDSHLCSFCQFRLFITLVLLLVICLFVALKLLPRDMQSNLFLWYVCAPAKMKSY